MVHIGSWGLPDFGITEAVGDIFGLSRNVEGGSQLKGSYSPTTQAYKTSNMSYTPSVGGGTYSYNTGGGSVQGANTSSAPSAPSGGGNYNVGDVSGGYRWTGAGWEPNWASSEWDSYRQEQERLQNEQIDAAYNPAYERLNTLEADYKQQFPTAQAAIEQSYGQVLPQLQSEQDTKLSGLKQQRQTGEKARKSQIAQARQMYNEMAQGGLTRFGGASSTGGAYSELLGRQTMQQMGNVNQNFADLNQQITQEEGNVNTYYSQKRTQLEEQKQLSLRQLKDEFDSRIRDINTNRQALDSEKAAKRLGALQELSASIRTMQAQYQQQNQLLNEWKAYKDEAINMAKQFQAKSFTIPGFKDVMGDVKITGANYGAPSYQTAQGYYNPEDLEKYGYFNYNNKLYPIKSSTNSSTSNGFNIDDVMSSW